MTFKTIDRDILKMQQYGGKFYFDYIFLSFHIFAANSFSSTHSTKLITCFTVSHFGGKFEFVCIHKYSHLAGKFESVNILSSEISAEI